MNPHIFLLVTLFTGIQCCGDFYWREYEGVIPKDAFLAGTTSNSRLSYIAQVYIHEVGLIVGTIMQYEDDIIVASRGLWTADGIVKILCVQDTSKYYWLSTRGATYKQDTAYKCPVLGGYNQTDFSENNTVPNHGMMHVGRVTESGSSSTSSYSYSYIGSIAAYNDYSEPLMSYYNFRLKQEEVTSYFSVLVYSDYPLK